MLLGPNAIVLRGRDTLGTQDSAPPDSGCVPDHVYFVGSMTLLLACGRRCVLPHGPVYLSRGWLVARARPNRSLLPLIGRED